MIHTRQSQTDPFNQIVIKVALRKTIRFKPLKLKQRKLHTSTDSISNQSTSLITIIATFSWLSMMKMTSHQIDTLISLKRPKKSHICLEEIQLTKIASDFDQRNRWFQREEIFCSSSSTQREFLRMLI